MTNEPFLLVCLPYAAIAIGLTIWLARALSHHGEVFLRTVFKDSPDLVHAVNQLLVIGFYLVNLGWAFLLAKGGGAVTNVPSAVGLLIDKLGILLLLLGAAHLMNLYVFHRIKKGAAA